MTDAGGNLFALVLAAGGSRRFGRPKQLLTIDGETLIRRALRRAASVSGPRVLAVLGCEWRRVLAAAGEATEFFLINEAWRQGLGSSLAVGTRGVPEDCDAVLVLLADQPLVDTGDLSRLASAWREAPDRIAACRYGDTIGVPAIFPRAVFPELRSLEGDRGAKPLLRSHRRDLTLVDCEHARLDIDTPEDAARLGAVTAGGD